MADLVAKIVGGLFIAAGFFAMVAVLGLLLSWPLAMLWNGCLVPAVGNVHEVSTLQMWGLLVLFGCLFKNSSVSTSKD